MLSTYLKCQSDLPISPSLNKLIADVVPNMESMAGGVDEKLKFLKTQAEARGMGDDFASIEKALRMILQDLDKAILDGKNLGEADHKKDVTLPQGSTGSTAKGAGDIQDLSMGKDQKIKVEDSGVLPKKEDLSVDLEASPTDIGLLLPPSLMSDSPDSGQPVSSAESVLGSDTVARVNDIVDRLVSSIAVHPQGESLVIELQSGVFSGPVSVMLTEKAGSFLIDFIAKTAESRKFLNDNTSFIEKTLKERTGQDIIVSIQGQQDFIYEDNQSFQPK